MEKGYHSCYKDRYEGNKLKASIHAHELVVGNYIPYVWRDLVQQSFSWAYTPEGSEYWSNIWGGVRKVKQKDLDILFVFYDVCLKEPTIEDII